MTLDIRIPIGLLFTILGLMLVAFGGVSVANAPMYERSLGVNVNLWWGLAMTVFGLVMLALAWRAKQSPARQSASTASEETPPGARTH